MLHFIIEVINVNIVIAWLVCPDKLNNIPKFSKPSIMPASIAAKDNMYENLLEKLFKLNCFAVCLQRKENNAV